MEEHPQTLLPKDIEASDLLLAFWPVVLAGEAAVQFAIVFIGYPELEILDDLFNCPILLHHLFVVASALG